MVFIGQIDGVHQLAVDVELQLIGGAVADAYRSRAHIPRQVIQRVLFEVVATVDAVHDFQGAVFFTLRAPCFQPFHETPGFFGEADSEQSVDTERCVADPGVAVVPVAHAAEVFRQARGGSGYECSGGFVG